MKNKNKKKANIINKTKGITLIALVITIIILLILAGISISAMTGSGLFGRAKEAKFKTKMAGYKEEADLYTSWKITESMNTNTKEINSGEMLKAAIEEQIIEDITTDDVTIEIREILKEIKSEEEEYIVVYEGELYYVSNKTIKDNDKQEQWCREIGIPILEYTPPTGIVVKNGNYELVNGVYLCTPKLNCGFVKEKTRYLEVNNNGNLVPGNWITDKPTEKWYNYKNNQWPNIYVENDGSEIYYVWIPRYCFKLYGVGDNLDYDGNEIGVERADVKFIDMNNNYKDEDGNEITWEQLETKGYQVPEAFKFDNKELPGYWAMKYTAGDITKPSTINYDMTVTQGEVEIRNIKLNTTITNTDPITKYTIALNGKIIKTIPDEEITNIEEINKAVIKFSNLRKGNNTINVTGLNANGEIVGSMTKEYAPAIVNKPELSGFNKETTFYVTYDKNGKEESTIPITEEMPQGWYEYGESRWANIVTRNNGLETYYTWIPRYEFVLDQTNERSIVKFISGTSEEAVTPGYQIPEAFEFDGKQITGYWAMKYTAGEETAPRFDTEVVATSNSIRTKGITGTAKEDGQVYKYYINGQYKGEETNSKKTYEYTNLNSNTKYTILIEIRNSTTDEYLGAIVKQISTIDANKPELIGFNTKETDEAGNKLPVTYYVLYDNNGNETIGDKIKNDGSNMPKTWYNYSERKWANIVVTDGEIKNGQIENATKTTYYTWIPRYEFMITSSQQKQPEKGRTEVRFIQGTSTETDIGYQIPEAFTFDGKELTGYWAMKYTAGE